MTRWIASFLAAAVVLLVALPASASAPQCDARGAITFAPPPKLDETNVSIDRTPPVCQIEALLDVDAYEHGRAPAPEAGTTQDIAPASSDPIVIAAPARTLPEMILDAPRFAEHRFGLERPPRH